MANGISSSSEFPFLQTSDFLYIFGRSIENQKKHENSGTISESSSDSSTQLGFAIILRIPAEKAIKLQLEHLEFLEDSEETVTTSVTEKFSSSASTKESSPSWKFWNFRGNFPENAGKETGPADLPVEFWSSTSEIQRKISEASKVSFFNMRKFANLFDFAESESSLIFVKKWDLWISSGIRQTRNQAAFTLR